MTFNSAAEAYEWAQGLLNSFRNGRAFDSNPELFRGGTGGISLKTLIAIDIDHLAVKACRNGNPCRHYDTECLLGWFLPEPTVVQQARSSHHTRCIQDCVWQFNEYLKVRGYVE